MRCKYSDIEQLGERTVDQFFEMEQEAGQESSTTLIIPDCTPGLMYIDEGSFSRRVGKETNTFNSGQLILFGQKKKSVEYQFDQNKLRAIGFKMMPHIIYTLFGISADEITDQAIDLRSCCPHSTQIIDGLLQGRIDQSLFGSCDIPGLLNCILRDIHQSKGSTSILALSERYNVGYKRIERLFKLHVGITPKLYTRIIRFNHSISISEKRNQNYTDTAYNSGYYDQNHYIREAKAFTGLPPSYLFDKSISGIEEDHLTYLKTRQNWLATNY